jgi:hypothetical protein
MVLLSVPSGSIMRSYAKAVALRDYTYQNTILARVDGV